MSPWIPVGTVAVLAAAAAGCGSDAVAPEADYGSLIVEVVVDGWSLPNVDVSANGPEGTTVVRSNLDGVALFPELAPGSYTLVLDGIDPDATVEAAPSVSVDEDHLTSVAIPGTFDPGRFVDVRMGATYSCALNENGNAYCWGFGGSGELGNGSFRGFNQPQRVRAPVAFTQITAGLAHACGLASGGTTYCWGTNLSGRLGRGLSFAELARAGVPGRIEGGTRFSVIDAGGSATCGVEVGSGRAHCWGSTQWGFLGSPGGSSNRPRPVATAQTFVSLSANDAWSGEQSVAAITESGQVYFWGALLEEGGSWMSFAGPEPTRIPLPAPATATTPACARLDDGRFLCWPDLEREVPDGVLERLVETSEPGLHEFQVDDLDPVFFRAGLPCTLEAAGYVCLLDWFVELPALEFGGEVVTRVATRGYAGCAVTDAGRVWCWSQVDFRPQVRAGPPRGPMPTGPSAEGLSFSPAGRGAVR